VAATSLSPQKAAILLRPARAAEVSREELAKLSLHY
jgi:hypothetical protein